MSNVLTSCDCIEQTDARLAERNLKLDVGIGVPFQVEGKGGPVIAIGRLILRTVKRDTGGKARMTAITCAYCPFCGVKAAP